MQHLYRPFLIAFLFINIFVSSFAQIGGGSTFDFLDRTNSARVAALGGNILAINDNDISLVLTNPSLINAEMNSTLALDFVTLNTAYNYGDIMYSRSFSKVGNFVGTFQFINYGSFTYADIAGNTAGTFSAGEYALTIGWGRTLSPHFSIGANGKLIYSQLESYHSSGIAVDVAGSYHTLDDVFSASLVARNIGYQLVPYIPGTHDPLPFESQVGVAIKLKHIPVRISVLYNNLEKWDLTYDDPLAPANQVDPITGQAKKQTGIGKFGDQLMRHIVVGTEITIAKVLSIRVGYNYRLRKEMELTDHTGLSGFTYGFGLRIKMFTLSYARATYMAGTYNPNYFSLAMNLGQFTHKKE
ncbi:MAG: type IX secretion system protein PorQ [Bacteroidales bacterium]